MKPIRIVPIGGVGRPLLDITRDALRRAFRTSCATAGTPLDPAFAYHRERDQYHSTQLLEHLCPLASDGEVLVGVTSLDLYIPILTFVFGEAQLGGRCAVVSAHRLAQEFYGLPPDETLLLQRLAKEAVHEVGHTAGLTHCDDYDCVMAASHSVEWLDVKTAEFCRACSAALL